MVVAPVGVRDEGATTPAGRQPSPAGGQAKPRSGAREPGGEHQGAGPSAITLLRRNFMTRLRCIDSTRSPDRATTRQVVNLDRQDPVRPGTCSRSETPQPAEGALLRRHRPGSGVCSAGGTPWAQLQGLAFAPGVSNDTARVARCIGSLVSLRVRMGPGRFHAAPDRPRRQPAPRHVPKTLPKSGSAGDQTPGCRAHSPRDPTAEVSR